MWKQEHFSLLHSTFHNVRDLIFILIFFFQTELLLPAVTLLQCDTKAMRNSDHFIVMSRINFEKRMNIEEKRKCEKTWSGSRVTAESKNPVWKKYLQINHLHYERWNGEMKNVLVITKCLFKKWEILDYVHREKK